VLLTWAVRTFAIAKLKVKPKVKPKVKTTQAVCFFLKAAEVKTTQAEACATKPASHSLVVELGYFDVESRNPSHGFEKCELTACGKSFKCLWVVPLGTTLGL
jgi:hypothetical protein